MYSIGMLYLYTKNHLMPPKNLFGSKKKILERNFLAFGGNADVFIEGSCNTTMQEGRVRKNIIVRWGVMKTS